MKKLKILFRSVKKNSNLTMIIVFCMALGFSATGIILGYVYQEYNYDAETLNARRIHRVIQKDAETHNPYTFAPLAQSLKSNYPEMEDAVRVSFFYGYLACSTVENKSNENSAIFADPGLFDLFSFPLKKGNSNECLRLPNSVVISEKAANKYFGNDDPIGKSLFIGKKAEFIVNELSFDAAINYRNATSLAKAVDLIAETAPRGVDVYFDNTGGVISDALFITMNPGARIVICGQISQYQGGLDEPVQGPRLLHHMLYKRATMRGILASDYFHRDDELRERMSAWIRTGQVKAKETTLRGFETLPSALTALFKGQNTGKLVVRK